MSADFLSNIRYVSAWKRGDAALEGDAMAMWREMGVMPAGVRPEERLKELVVLAYKGARLVGITSAEVRPYAPLRQRFAFMRMLMRPEAQAAGLAVPLTVHLRETLRQWSFDHPQELLAGYGAVVTDKHYMAQPILPAGLTLVGYTPDGHQVRVFWWDHFRIPVS
ncbi:MAG: hypothetical protein Q7T44_12870 [Parvibaculum sp.]|nr:hypothetical protein [Parvibaculum sp.]